MNSKQKKAAGWSVFSVLACINVCFGIGIWTPLLCLGAILMAPPVLKFVTKKLKFKKTVSIFIAALLITAGGLSWWIKGSHESFSELADNIISSQTQNTAAKTTASEHGITENSTAEYTYSIGNVPEFCGEPYVVINRNEPDFDKNTEPEAFEKYTPLDRYGRCVEAFACVCTETMPKEKRGDIYSVKPSGWQHVEYDFIDGKSLYNRCHLIGFQLTAENDNNRNLITGTRYMNTEMIPFENMIADYIKETNNHVLYKVNPIFKGKEMLARGVHMQAYSIEDSGDGICFNVYLYNVQPGVVIDYSTGKSGLDESYTTVSAKNYVLNVRGKKFHLESCPGIEDISENNRKNFTGTRDELIKKGYSPCGKCNP